MKRVRVDPEAVRKANREAASKEDLIKALEVISSGADEEEQHKAGVHRFIINGDCTGNNSKEACYITCCWCYEGDHPVENTKLDPTATNGNRFCYTCLDKMAAIAAVLSKQPANKKQKVDLNIILLP